ncbi:hypothetical protein E2C01_037211 [Portunus trituberculatus]|uniref:Uncharacterized protein n=1 Tax=Portunus trituberculatus TaxID=210409 RepID=A0A5B7F8R9_PORTR|nr:hypothetical protein [Portunus trituberculatus]
MEGQRFTGCLGLSVRQHPCLSLASLPPLRHTNISCSPQYLHFSLFVTGRVVVYNTGESVW